MDFNAAATGVWRLASKSWVVAVVVSYSNEIRHIFFGCKRGEGKCAFFFFLFFSFFMFGRLAWATGFVKSTSQDMKWGHVLVASKIVYRNLLP